MKKLMLITFVTTCAFGAADPAPSILLYDNLLNELSHGSEIRLIGKNLKNNEACYLKLSADEYKLSQHSIDISGLFVQTDVKASLKRHIKKNQENDVELVNAEIKSLFLADRAKAKISKNKNIVRVSIYDIQDSRFNKKLECEYNIDENRNVPSIPENCEAKDIRKKIAACTLNSVKTKPASDIANASVDLLEVKTKKCVPGKEIEVLKGYETSNAHYEFSSGDVFNGTWDSGKLFEINSGDTTMRSNNFNKYYAITRIAGPPKDKYEFTYLKRAKTIEMKSHKKELFWAWSLEAKFNCH